MTFLRCATRWHRAHLVCVVFPSLTRYHLLPLSLSLTHLFRMLYALCVILWSAWRSGYPLPPTPPSLLFLYTFSAPCVALFNTLWQHLSSLLFGIVDPAQKTKQRKKIEVGKKESTNISLYIWLRISFLSFRFVSLRSVCCLHSSTIFMVALKTHKMCPWHLWCDNVT